MRKGRQEGCREGGKKGHLNSAMTLASTGLRGPEQITSLSQEAPPWDSQEGETNSSPGSRSREWAEGWAKLPPPHTSCRGRWPSLKVPWVTNRQGLTGPNAAPHNPQCPSLHHRLSREAPTPDHIGEGRGRCTCHSRMPAPGQRSPGISSFMLRKEDTRQPGASPALWKGSHGLQANPLLCTAHHRREGTAPALTHTLTSIASSKAQGTSRPLTSSTGTLRRSSPVPFWKFILKRMTKMSPKSLANQHPLHSASPSRGKQDRAPPGWKPESRGQGGEGDSGGAPSACKPHALPSQA